MHPFEYLPIRSVEGYQIVTPFIQEVYIEQGVLQKKESILEVPIKKQISFEQRHRRITTYLENETFEQVKSLNKDGEIKSITYLINTAVKEYIGKYFGNSNF
jgi:hypothetical protein